MHVARRGFVHSLGYVQVEQAFQPLVGHKPEDRATDDHAEHKHPHDDVPLSLAAAHTGGS